MRKIRNFDKVLSTAIVCATIFACTIVITNAIVRCKMVEKQVAEIEKEIMGNIEKMIEESVIEAIDEDVNPFDETQY